MNFGLTAFTIFLREWHNINGMTKNEQIHKQKEKKKRGKGEKKEEMESR